VTRTISPDCPDGPGGSALSCGRSTVPPDSDLVVFYLKQPVSAFVATGTIIGNELEDGADHGWPGRKMARVVVDRVAERAFSMRAASQRFGRRWGWLVSPIASGRVPADVEPALRGAMFGTKAGAVAAVADGTVALRKVAAGFGASPEENRAAEQAGIRFARAKLRRDGWTVTDRQKDACGYDLECRRGRRELHVEFKGVTGETPGFVITHNERECARRDPYFALWVVTAARTKRPTLHAFAATDLDREFDLRAISYIATLKRQ
jgi:hypothetical protein